MNINIYWTTPSPNRADYASSEEYLLDFYSAIKSRRVSLSYVRYVDSHTESHFQVRNTSRAHRQHQRRVLRFKRKLRALVID